ncbi:hypothetical protein BASA81_003035 [Batrachochytrium salamandrivorans]|nr:hypothetical protein BASA81_003035 [Batrachochytrium salamandrivorans]
MSPTTKLAELRLAMRRLKQAGVADAADSIRLFLRHAQTRSEFEEMLRRRVDREPAQYILGEWDFHLLKRPLVVRPPMLIPRPETEEFVELVLGHTTLGRSRVLDIGVGTGAIGLALASARPNWRVCGIDLLPEACALANENANRLGLYPDRYKCLPQAVGVSEYQSESAFDWVVSNPPYIPSADIPSLQSEITKHESHLALDGGEDGGQVVRQILSRFDLLKPGGSLFLEVHHTHTTEAVMEWIKPYPHIWAYRQAWRDFNGHLRFLCFDRT